MKYEIKKETKVFKPITITITLETVQDVRGLEKALAPLCDDDLPGAYPLYLALTEIGRIQ